eukprot:TRINITY_DN1036_c0_g2_i4.p1 TRINITY_DN1036_c0_g2~~TRINITY_DN1036_c0_g2_i4.p1  ORF type:complete len:147 (+),score=28.55 TRINITY_DN1036_c0_g2_i4:92-532(+)
MTWKQWYQRRVRELKNGYHILRQCWLMKRKRDLSEIPSGLTYIPNWLSPEEERNLLTQIDGQPWSSQLSRRVQHYGWAYSYTTKTLTPDAHLGPLPAFFSSLIQRFEEENLTDSRPDQVIVNGFHNTKNGTQFRRVYSWTRYQSPY